MHPVGSYFTRLWISRRLESGQSWSVVLASYNIEPPTMWYIQTEGPVMIINGIEWKCSGLYQATDIKTA